MTTIILIKNYTLDILIKELKNSKYIIYLLIDETPIEAYIMNDVENRDRKIKEIESIYKINYHKIINYLN